MARYVLSFLVETPANQELVVSDEAAGNFSNDAWTATQATAAEGITLIGNGIVRVADTNSIE